MTTSPEAGQPGPWAFRAASALLGAWRSLPVRSKLPEARPLEEPTAPREAPAPFYLGEPTQVEGRIRREAAIPLDEGILANRMPQAPIEGRPGQMFLWLPTVDVLAGEQDEPTCLVMDPSREPPKRNIDDLHIPEPKVRAWHRRARSRWQGGYRQPADNQRGLDHCRRQLHLRTDLTRLAYPRIPVPGRLMRGIGPGAGSSAGLEFELERVGLEPEALQWDRFPEAPLMSYPYRPIRHRSSIWPAPKPLPRRGEPVHRPYGLRGESPEGSEEEGARAEGGEP